MVEFCKPSDSEFFTPEPEPEHFNLYFENKILRQKTGARIGSFIPENGRWGYVENILKYIYIYIYIYHAWEQTDKKTVKKRAWYICHEWEQTDKKTVKKRAWISQQTPFVTQMTINDTRG
jgi:hypothetical protein